jgi:hypothetical protein
VQAIVAEIARGQIIGLSEVEREFMADTDTKITHLAFVVFGEAATAFVSGWLQGRPKKGTAFDIKTDDEMQARYADHDVPGMATLTETLAGVQAVFSVVTGRSGCGADAELTIWNE